MDSPTAPSAQTPPDTHGGVCPFPDQLEIAFAPPVCPQCGASWLSKVRMVECLMTCTECKEA
jgi:hypothetical protein